jgi:uncharacterized OB-fold protein
MSAPRASSRPVQPGLFQLDPPALLGSRCDDCGRHAFPRASSCPYCGSARVADVLLSAGGTLWGWTTVTAAPPGYRGEVPFGFGIVELPEGVRVITRLTAPVDAYAFGMPVRLRIVPLHTDDESATVETWEFGP